MEDPTLRNTFDDLRPCWLKRAKRCQSPVAVVVAQHLRKTESATRNEHDSHVLCRPREQNRNSATFSDHQVR